MKKRSFAILIAVVTLVVTGIFVANFEQKTVYAEDENVLYLDEGGSFIAEYVDDISRFRGEDKIAPEATTEGYETWLFAGWYKEQECAQKNALYEKTSTGGAWAKFVPSDVLSVKCQVKNDVQDANVKKTNMRLVSSVDSLAYENVGFQVVFDDGSMVQSETESVYERIVTSEKSNVEYEYNPKIIDAESEYFYTITLLNIAKASYGETYLVKPYWITLDGTTVYGEGRYVKVSDSYSNLVNIPVKVENEAQLLELDVEGKTIGERRYFAGEAYGALMVPETNIATLPSLTTYHVSDGSSIAYRNMYASYQGNGDQSWYTNADSDKYVIVTLADLYGFASLVNNGNDFEGKTVYLGADIVVNIGTASGWKSSAPSYVWTPIGSAATPFNGTFDGCLDEISGIYVSGGSDHGFFGYVEANGIIQNLEINNSAFVGASATKTIGSVVGYLRGKVSRLYATSDVYLYNVASGEVKEGYGTGGIVGLFERDGITTPGSISECWFAGSVTSSRASVGGILGHAYKGTLDFENCLYTGSVRSTFQGSSGTSYAYAGGLIGGTRSWVGAEALYVNLSDSLSLGTVKVNGIYGIGSIVGRNIHGTVTVKNTYTKDAVTNAESETIASDGTILGFGNYSLTAGMLYGMPMKVTSESVLGKDGYASMDLDYYTSKNANGVWAAISNKAPELKVFTDKEIIKDFSDTNRELTAWYYNAFTYAWTKVTNADGTVSYPVINNQTTYTIYDGWDLHGLRKIVNEKIDKFGDVTYTNPAATIKNRKVVLANDIVMYEGKATDWAEGKNLPKVTWSSIGLNNEASLFSGTFDGQGHTISGVYAVDSEKVSGVYNYLGIFGAVAPTGTIKNVNLKNSYFRQEVADGFAGSICADIRGSMDSVYSDAIIDTCGQQNGGICARINGQSYNVSGSSANGDLVKGRRTVAISNVWFDGTLRVYGMTASTNYAGGIGGVVVQGTAELTNVVFTGKIETVSTSNTAYVGGMIGSAMAQTCVGYQEGSESKMNLSSCISAGVIEAPSGYRSAVIGRAGNGISNGAANNTYTTLTNVFASRECWSVPIQIKGKATSGDITAEAFVTGTTIQTRNTDRLIGYCTEENTNEKLDFENAFSMRKSGVPIPKTLENVVGASQIVDVSELSKEIGLDYWNGSLANAVNYGIGNYVLSFSANDTSYQAYLTKLVALGFEKYVDNSASTMDDDGIYNVIYTKDSGDWVLHITYVSKESKIYISVNTLGKDNLDDNLISAKQEGNKDVMFSNIELPVSGYGNGFLFQLPNGHFIVIDGGTSSDGEAIISYLKALSDGEVYIDAWVITHFHSDHCAAFNQFASNASLREGVYLEAVYASEPSNYSKIFENNQISVTNNAYLAAMSLTKADGSRPDIVRMHMGERFYFNGVTMDVIHTQEQLTVSSYDDYDDPDAFNATSSNCIFTVNETGNKIYSGGDSTKVNMNYIMRAFDGITATIKHKTENLIHFTATDPAEITRTNSKTLSNISVFITFHHGKNTANAFTRYLVGSSSDEYKFDVVLYPYQQLMNPTFKLYYNGYPGCYWMEDDSCVFDYKMETVNAELLKNVRLGYYTFGYEDSVSGASASNPHGTVELTFTSNGIEVNVLKSWKNGFTMEKF